MNKPVSYFSILFVLVVLTMFCTTCIKEYSYEGGNTDSLATGTAVYTLEGVGDTCTGSLLNGKYYVDTLLTSANSVQLQVNVTAIGTYFLRTNTVNGIQFSVSGTFTDTGMQTITLEGSGTPVSAGNFTYTPPVGAGCTFIVSVIKALPPVAAFELEGSPNACTGAVLTGSYIYGKPLTSGNFVVIIANVIAPGTYNITTDTIDGISFSAIGNFTSIGNQNVKLFGSGTPPLPRNLTFFPKGTNSGCSFDVAIINAEPLATYVLQSSFGSSIPCINVIRSGSYISNVSLSSANTVSIDVFVTVAGNFTIATNTVDGFMFSYTGTFTTTGDQNVILYGSGTPISSGPYSFSPQIVGPHPLGGETCGFTITVQ